MRLVKPRGYNCVSKLAFTTVSSTVTLLPDEYSGRRYFGQSVSINSAGDVAVVGASGWSGPAGDFQGAAYVFQNIGGTWLQVAKLLPSDPQVGAMFGNSVSINSSGDVAIVGAVYWDGPAGGSQGKAYIFQNIGGTWQQVAGLLPNDPQELANFGGSVSINSAGDVAIVSAYDWDGPAGAGQGKVYVFQDVGGTWQQIAELLPSDPQASANFGSSVSINSNGDIAIVGAEGWGEPAGAGQGKAYIFQNIGGTWQQVAELLPSDPQAGANFGSSVSINSNGDIAIVGAYHWDGLAGANQGKAYIFQDVGGTWQQVAELLPSDPQAGAAFGWSVSINSTGDIAIVGAFWWDGPAGTDQGKAYVFQNIGGTWLQVAELLPSDLLFHAYFGNSVSINSMGDIAIVGAPHWLLSTLGKAYIFIDP